MTRSILTALVLFPAGASACGMGAGPGPGACASGRGCGAMSLVAMAAIAALGVWVLRASEKDGGGARRAGQAGGWVLAVVGWGGFLCGAISYGVKRSRGCRAPA